MENEIKLVQAPIIKHDLVKIGVSVSERIAELNLENQIATPDTIQSIKTLRADLKKELDTYEDQRKVVKTAVNNPYDEFNATYKEEVEIKYTAAITILKDKIGIFETKVKEAKKANVMVYFNELCVAMDIDFVKPEHLGIKIDLSTTEAAYKKKIKTFIDKVNNELALIETTEYQTEILTEYKKSLNVSEAIISVKTRKADEAAEDKRILLRRNNARKQKLSSLGLAYKDFTQSFEYNEDIYITIENVESLKDDEFSDAVIGIEEAIRLKVKADAEVVEAKRLKELAIAAPKTTEENTTVEAEEIKEPIKKEPAPQIAAPVVEKKAEKQIQADFNVTCTMTQLRALGVYMKKNNITYKNI